MENPDFLKAKYNNFHTTPEVESAVRNTEIRMGEKVPQNPADHIQNYLDRLERLILDPKKEQKISRISRKFPDRPRALSWLREMIMNEYIRPNKDKLAEGAVLVEERAARQLGIPLQYGEAELEARGDISVRDLEGSLDQWISYLSDANEPYPTWFRYYAFRNILELGEYDKDKQEFPKRSPGTNRLFPDIDRGALARIQDIIECSKDETTLERFRKAQKATDTPADQLLTKEKARTFSNLSFAKQYAESMKEAGEITPEMRAETRGKWIPYEQNSEPTALWASLQNKGTAWCTKGFATAETQLKGGDFYVYYTLDKQGKPTIPRIAIRMQGGAIFEARGVADSQQNLEGNMLEIANEKMSTLPGKEKYHKISADMKIMTTLYSKSFKEDRKTGEKTYLNPILTKPDLIFLYEINEPIKGFGYQKDPRIEELRKARDKEKDMPIVLGCTKEQIARTPADIIEHTKAYVGPLVNRDERGKSIPFFQIIREYNIEHIYTSFPEGKLHRYQTEIGGTSKDELKAELKEEKIYSSDWANLLLEHKDFTVLQSTEQADLVCLTVADLGFSGGATTDEIYKKAEELGLELCPAEVGPHLRLSYSGGDLMYIAMKPITDRGGDPAVFGLYRAVDVLKLSARNGGPDRGWGADRGFVFLLRRKKL